jgi:hypothetical protein
MMKITGVREIREGVHKATKHYEIESKTTPSLHSKSTSRSKSKSCGGNVQEEKSKEAARHAHSSYCVINSKITPGLINQSRIKTSHNSFFIIARIIKYYSI